jgi:hypothetical protein
MRLIPATKPRDIEVGGINEATCPHEDVADTVAFQNSELYFCQTCLLAFKEVKPPMAERKYYDRNVKRQKVTVKSRKEQLKCKHIWRSRVIE